MSEQPQPQPEQWRLLTTNEVARHLRVSAETVRRLHRRNQLQAVPGIGKLLFRASAIDDFLCGRQK
jgi:excisionase family DNA binding protein